MARKQRSKKSSPKRRYSARQILLYLISMLIILSMVLAFLFSVLSPAG